MLTLLCNINTLKAYSCTVNLEFDGVSIIFHISAQKRRLLVLIEVVLTSTQNCFEQKKERSIKRLPRIANFTIVKNVFHRGNNPLVRNALSHPYHLD